MDQFGGMSDGVNISDVIEVIQQDEIGGAQGNDDIPVEIIDEMPRNPSLMLGNPASMAMQPMGIQNETPKPYIEIIEQPSTGIRFRYEIEGRSAGSIPGKHSKQDMKTFPTIRIVGYSGRMTVVVSCVTVEDNPRQKPRPHPHKLVGKQQCKNGVCRVDVKGENMTIPFPNLGIQCVRKKDVEASLTERERERVDPFNTGFAHKRSPSNFALNKVRLCFQGFIPKKENGRIQWMSLAPVVSVPILEKKATYTLDILKMSHYSATVAGGLEMILLCDKVPKEEIQIRFFEDHGDSLWEAFADFQPAHVHHQYAITFRTPKYDNQEITEPVKVKVQLKLRNKPEGGEPRDFEMLPLGTANIGGKRKTPKDRFLEFSTLKPEKRLKTISPSLHDFIKCEPRLSPYMAGGSVSPNPYLPAPSTSPQPGSSYPQYRTQASPGPASPIQPIYNIPLDQCQPHLQNHYEFHQALQIDTQPQPPTMPMDNSMNAIYLDTPPLQPYQQCIGGVIYQVPAELNLQNEGINLLDLDSQQLLSSGAPFGTSELLNAVLDDKMSEELNQGLQINDPTPELDTEQPSGMTDSLTRLTRDIESLNEMCKPHLN